MYGIKDELNAFYFDRAVTTFGHAIEAALHEASKDAKTTAKAQQARDKTLREWLDLGGPQFRDPAGTSSGVKASSESSGPVKI